MTLHAERNEAAAVVVLQGELDLANAGDITELVTGAITAGVSSLVLDLAQVDFMDSTGISALIAGKRAFDAIGGQLALRAPSPAVRTVLHVAGLESFLAVD